MVHTIFKFLILFWVSVCIVPTSADAYPVERNGADASISGTHTALAVVIGIGSLIGLVYALFNCSCCDESSLLKYEETPEDDDPAIVQEDDDFSPPTESTPAGEDKTPLEVTPVINLSAASGVDTSAVEPFNDPRLQFSRDQLNYLDEIGSGWFGKALRGEAEQIHPGMRKTRVVVKQLKDSATPDEQVLFLKEVQPYREVNHPNVLMLLGQCLETTPLLLVMEYAPNGDLKAFLGKNKDKMQSFAQDDVLLKMATDVISGLVWLHQKEFVHIDLAARNCQVCADNVVKIGDYGTSLEHYPDDYYMTKDQRHAVPIRWLSPEVINADQEDIEPKKITKQSNIWSFGVIMLEISTGAETPYPKLTDEEVLQKIVRERQIQLDKPNLAMKYADRWFETMAFCWLDEADRPNTKEVSDLVHHLNTYKDQLNQADFDSRWNALKPAAARESDPGMDIPQPQVPVIEEVVSVTPESQQLSESPPQFEDEDEEFEPRAGEITNPFMKDDDVAFPKDTSTPMPSGDESSAYVTATGSFLDPQDGTGVLEVETGGLADLSGGLVDLSTGAGDQTTGQDDEFNTLVESMMDDTVKSLKFDDQSGLGEKGENDVEDKVGDGSMDGGEGVRSGLPEVDNYSPGEVEGREEEGQESLEDSLKLDDQSGLGEDSKDEVEDESVADEDNSGLPEEDSYSPEVESREDKGHAEIGQLEDSSKHDESSGLGDDSEDEVEDESVDDGDEDKSGLPQEDSYSPDEVEVHEEESLARISQIEDSLENSLEDQSRLGEDSKDEVEDESVDDGDEDKSGLPKEHSYSPDEVEVREEEGQVKTGQLEDSLEDSLDDQSRLGEDSKDEVEDESVDDGDEDNSSLSQEDSYSPDEVKGREDDDQVETSQLEDSPKLDDQSGLGEDSKDEVEDESVDDGDKDNSGLPEEDSYSPDEVKGREDDDQVGTSQLEDSPELDDQSGLGEDSKDEVEDESVDDGDEDNSDLPEDDSYSPDEVEGREDSVEGDRPADIIPEDERDENQNDGSKMFHSEAGIAIAEPPAKPIRQQPEESPPEPHQFHGYAQVEKKKDSSGPKKLTITVSSGHKSKTLEIDNSPPKDEVATTAPVVVSPQPGGVEGHGDAPATLSFTIAGKKQEEEDPSQDDSPAEEETTNGHGVIDDGLEKDDDNIDRKRGKLHFSVVYSEQKQELQCMVHRAHNLKAMDPNGFSDPYVKLHILPRASSRSTKLRTKTKYKTLDPEFMEELTYHGIIADDLHTKTLRLSVWDEDSLGHNDFIGEYLLPLHKLPLNETKSYSMFLQDKSEEDEEISESERGKILLGLQYYEKTNQISVRIIRCAGLYAMDTNGYSDPYVKLYLQPDPKKKTKQKTATKKKTLNPEYMETFMYKLHPEDIHTKTLEVTVWDKDVGSNDYIGGVQLGSTTRGDRRQHWTDAIENPDQMIERWHLLSETQFTEDD